LFRAQHVNQRIVNDFDDLLAGCDGFQDLRTNGLLGYLVYEVADNGQCNVGLKQGNAHFAHRFTHIGFVQRTATAQAIKHTS
jgi:hypothetical protein